jgi:hypothetical protein
MALLTTARILPVMMAFVKQNLRREYAVKLQGVFKAD